MSNGRFPKIEARHVGLAAVVLFAPGGFILGATLAARWWQQRGARGA